MTKIWGHSDFKDSNLFHFLSYVNSKYGLALKKELIMKAYVMGNYTDKAFQGFMKDPTSDRKAVVEQLVKAVGGKIHSMDIVRGPYDFIVVTEVESFDDLAAIKLVVEASGAVKNMTMLEAIDFTKATTKASKIGYKAPGQ